METYARDVCLAMGLDSLANGEGALCDMVQVLKEILKDKLDAEGPDANPVRHIQILGDGARVMRNHFITNFGMKELRMSNFFNSVKGLLTL